MYQKIIAEAVQELKETEFKELFKEENAQRPFVQECAIETDLELVLPDNYVNDVTERIALYKELDDLETEEDLQKFQEHLIDRFGPIPKQTNDLLDTMRLRKMAKDIGFEKLVLKSETLIGTFVADQKSPYYQSDKFTCVLNFIQTQPRAAKMEERNNKLRLVFKPVATVQDAIQKLNLILG
jgi:transcription-repair coupling factor (superfamily II helicase)